MSSGSISCFSILAGWEALEVTGPDALEFLQRMTTVDVRVLTPGRFAAGALLQANGKLVVYFKLLRLEASNFLLLVPPGLPPHPTEPARTAHEAFDKFLFRENLQLQPRVNEWTYFRCLAADNDALAVLQNTMNASAPLPAVREFTKGSDNSMVINEGRWNKTGDFGCLITREHADKSRSLLLSMGWKQLASMEAYRIQSADPAPGRELTTDAIPLEAGLSDSIPQNKGCYPGQEVIERIRSMGQLPRKLVQLRGEGAAPPVSSTIAFQGAPAGTITSIATLEDNRWLGLGFVRRALVPADVSTLELTVEGKPVEGKFPS